MGTPAAAQATNVLEGFELYRGRYCGVIRQTLNAQQDGGALHAPESALSEASDFSLPEFRLSGENLIYFDVDNGELVEATLNLDLTMQIGEQLKPVADMLNLYGQLLNEIDGLGAAPDGSGEALLDLGMNIQASLSLFMP
jgi:hypothetical protein